MRPRIAEEFLTPVRHIGHIIVYYYRYGGILLENPAAAHVFQHTIWGPYAMKTSANHLIAVAALLLLGGALCVDAAGQSPLAVGNLLVGDTNAVGHCALASRSTRDMTCKGEPCSFANQIVPAEVRLSGTRISESELPSLILGSYGYNEQSLFAADDDGQAFSNLSAATIGTVLQQPQPLEWETFCALASKSTRKQRKKFDHCMDKFEGKDFCSYTNSYGDRLVNDSPLKAKPLTPSRETACTLPAYSTKKQRKRFYQCMGNIEYKSLRSYMNFYGDLIATGRLLEPGAIVCALPANPTKKQRKNFKKCMGKFKGKEFCSHTNWHGGRIVRGI